MTSTRLRMRMSNIDMVLLNIRLQSCHPRRVIKRPKCRADTCDHLNDLCASTDLIGKLHPPSG